MPRQCFHSGVYEASLWPHLMLWLSVSWGSFHLNSPDILKQLCYLLCWEIRLELFHKSPCDTAVVRPLWYLSIHTRMSLGWDRFCSFLLVLLLLPQIHTWTNSCQDLLKRKDALYRSSHRVTQMKMQGLKVTSILLATHCYQSSLCFLIISRGTLDSLFSPMLLVWGTRVFWTTLPNVCMQVTCAHLECY